MLQVSFVRTDLAQGQSLRCQGLAAYVCLHNQGLRRTLTLPLAAQLCLISQCKQSMAV